MSLIPLNALPDSCDDSRVEHHGTIPTVQAHVAVVRVTIAKPCAHEWQPVAVQLLRRARVPRLDSKHQAVIPLLDFFCEVYELRLVDTAVGKAPLPGSLAHNLWGRRVVNLRAWCQGRAFRDGSLVRWALGD